MRVLRPIGSGRCGGWLQLAFVLALLAPTSNAHSELSGELQRLADLVEHRARFMPDVARWKWHRDLPVRDETRESEVLEASSRVARQAGLEPSSARNFVAAQMRIAREIQQARYAAWQSSPPETGGPDLQSDLRPAISATTQEILRVLPRLVPLRSGDAVRLEGALVARLVPLGASDAAAGDLARSIAALRAVPADAPRQPRLQRILAAGVLRVGTTFDYPPFSHLDVAGQASGIDIDLARHLAGTLGVRVEFVPTTWPTLMEDLAAGRFDIGMSGISRTLERARVADFSSAHHVGGKSAIVRCEDAGRWATLAEIDHPDVTVIVNPGGTNERFARANVQRAALRVFDDNTRIFEEIREHRADVMFTDAIEIRLQTALEPALCAGLDGALLNHQSKGFLLPRHAGVDADGAWRRYVDLWLEQLRADGTLQEVFARNLGGD